MHRLSGSEDWYDDDVDAGDDEDAGDGQGEEPTIDCPHCGREMLEDSPWCPSCGQYVSDADRRANRRPPWVIVTALVCLAAVVWWVLARG